MRFVGVHHGLPCPTASDSRIIALGLYPGLLTESKKLASRTLPESAVEYTYVHKTRTRVLVHHGPQNKIGVLPNLETGRLIDTRFIIAVVFLVLVPIQTIGYMLIPFTSTVSEVPTGSQKTRLMQTPFPTRWWRQPRNGGGANIIRILSALPLRITIFLAVLVAHSTVGAFSAFTGTPSSGFKAKSRIAYAASSGVDPPSVVDTRLDQSPKQQPPCPPPLGGDYAGIMATFDAHTGKLIPIPEHYIPQSLLEWGQVPSALEVLVSEVEHQSLASTTPTTTSRLNRNLEPILMKRQCLTILPETGCGVDNLETVQEDEPELVLHRDFASSWSSRTKNNQQQSFRIETVFGLVIGGDVDKNEQQQNPYRSRISIDLALVAQTNNESRIIQPTQIRIYLERQIQTKSTGGTVAKGGGLDGQRVARWMGPILSSRSMQSFAEIAPSGTSSTEQFKDSNDDDISDAVVHTVTLPANVTVQYIRDATRPSTLSVAMGQVDSSQGSREWVIHHLAVQSGNIVVDKSYDISTEP